jgi:hypothetical protein
MIVGLQRNVARSTRTGSFSLQHSNGSITFPSNRQQTRSHWQAFLTKKLDRSANIRGTGARDDSGEESEQGQYRYDDWVNVARGFQDPMKDRKSLLQLHLDTSREHIKPTEQRRRIKSNKIHQRSVKRVDDLNSYIQFVKDHKEDFRK